VLALDKEKTRSLAEKRPHQADSKEDANRQKQAGRAKA
jgi:hypothetical protein